MSEKNKDNRSRLWSTIIYPESAPEDWQERLSSLLLRGFISPLHNLDKKEDGTIKKPHYHILFIFNSKKSLEQIKDITDQIGGVGQFRIDNKLGAERYLCHLDHPEKAQYNPDDVIALGGMDYKFEIGAVVNKYTVIREMIDFVENNSCEYYCDLVDYAAQYNDEWFRVLCDNGSWLMKEYIKSFSFKNNKIKED